MAPGIKEHIHCTHFHCCERVTIKFCSMKTESGSGERKILIAIALMLSLFIHGCAWDKTPLVGNGNDGVKDSICYEEEIQPLINSNCAKSGCHDAITHADGYDLSSYYGIIELVKPGKPDNSKLIEVISASGEDVMPPPPDPPLNQEQVDLIRQWITEGAGINIDCNVSVLCDTLNVTYSETITSIIQSNCLGCHSSTGTGGGILLNTYSGVKQQVTNGRLWGSINWQSGFSQMPQNAAKLSDCDITKIGIWIQDGAPNN